MLNEPTNADLEQRIGHVEKNVEELAIAVVGPKVSDFRGGGRAEEEGLIAKVDELIRTLNNGGIKIRLPIPVWVAIIAALGGLVVQLIATLGS